MNLLTPLYFLMAGFGAYSCLWASIRWSKQGKGEQQFTLTNLEIPWVVWPLIIFAGVMCIAATVPVLLGQPMWLLDKVFFVISYVLKEVAS